MKRLKIQLITALVIGIAASVASLSFQTTMLETSFTCPPEPAGTLQSMIMRGMPEVVQPSEEQGYPFPVRQVLASSDCTIVRYQWLNVVGDLAFWSLAGLAVAIIARPVLERADLPTRSTKKMLNKN